MKFGSSWGGFPDHHPLSDDDVHVWCIDSEIAPVEFAKLLGVLSQDERERADRFHFEADRQRAVIGRGYLLLLVGGIVKLPPDKLRFAYNDFGKPRLNSLQAGLLQFNVSHSAELILIAIAVGRAVGIDVERIRTGFDVEEVARRFFSDREHDVLASLDGNAKTEAFFRLWTLKEAYLKARGIGLSAPLDAFDVAFSSEPASGESIARPDAGEAGEWKLRSLGVSTGYAAALAAWGADWRLKCWSPSRQLLSGLSI
jgi:4'-phosphopantetheinyl transferase